MKSGGDACARSIGCDDFPVPPAVGAAGARPDIKLLAADEALVGWGTKPIGRVIEAGVADAAALDPSGAGSFCGAALRELLSRCGPPDATWITAVAGDKPRGGLDSIRQAPSGGDERPSSATELSAGL